MIMGQDAPLIGRRKIEKKLHRDGFAGLYLSKTGGIWYLLGDENVTNHLAERCLHVLRLDLFAMEMAIAKAIEITQKEIP